MATNNEFKQSILHRIKYNKDGSYSTQASRREILLKSAKDLAECGFKRVTEKNFGARHATALSNLWQSQKISNATIKNRLSHLRWYASTIQKPSAIPRNNDLFVGRRKYLDNTTNKAHELDHDKLNKLTVRQQLSLRLQREFGLRREESLKFNPSYADKIDKISLKASWCKGGRARDVLIRTDEQRKLLNECHAVAQKGSMIEKTTTYINACEALKRACINADIRNMHGFRHAYAQERFLELTGFECPKNDGKLRKDMTQQEREIDLKARLEVSSELGHNREEITKAYLGS